MLACQVIAIALTVRILVTRVALVRSGLTPKEAALVCVAWLPKATVQAAVGGSALDLMLELNKGCVSGTECNVSHGGHCCVGGCVAASLGPPLRGHGFGWQVGG